MNVFMQKFNPMTRANDWIMQNEKFDYHQDIARSSFADMLHDTERNQKYDHALAIAIKEMHSNGKKANVLDIGTGSGLLSMMAVRNGADSVVACEAFEPIGKCALKVIAENGFADKIRIINKRSVSLVVGEGGDLEAKCNILVAEVFDTELIGEGALSTFKHAHEKLLEKECIVIPHSATVFAQVVECPLAQNWNKLKDVYDNDGNALVLLPQDMKDCAGSASVHDVQLSEIKQHSFKTILSPIAVLKFDWSGRTPITYGSFTVNKAKVKNSGVAQVVFMWWELGMDMENEIILSCAPIWAHPGKGSKIPWRDHWMQAIYYLPQEIIVEKDKEVSLFSYHDEYSLWFHLKHDSIEDNNCLRPFCDCLLHMSYSRIRIAQLNDAKRTKKYLSLVENNHINQNTVVLVISESCIFSLAAAKQAKKIYYIETDRMSRRLMQKIVDFNGFCNVEIHESFETLNIKDERIGFVFGEPFFLTSILPWDNLLFAYQLQAVKRLLAADCAIFPQIAIIKGVAVNFDNLHKIRVPVRRCEGFIMDDFDHLIGTSSDISDDSVEAQPLWEYPGIAVSEVVEIATIDMIEISEKMCESIGAFKIQKGLGGCNGVALWVEWLHMDHPKRVTFFTGPIAEPEIGQKIDWDMNAKQGVSLFENRDVESIFFKFQFDFSKGNFNFTLLE